MIDSDSASTRRKVRDVHSTTINTIRFPFGAMMQGCGIGSVMRDAAKAMK
jgi:hypothetical protein